MVNKQFKSVFIFCFLLMIISMPGSGQALKLSKEELITLTSQWEGKRFPDGLPHVPDDIMERMKLVNIEEAWSVLRNAGYNYQLERGWKHVHPGGVLVGRALTTIYMPLRPDVDKEIRKAEEAAGYFGNEVSWPVDMLVPGDVSVADAWGNEEGGVIIGDSPQEPVYIDKGGLSELISSEAEPEMLATGFRVAQGPAIDKNGDFFFSDIYNNKIMKWEFEGSRLLTIREQPGGPDGLFVEADGSLLVCELTGLRFARLTPQGKYEIIATEYNGKKLSGPNDVYVDRHGGIYFSDSYPGADIRGPVHCVYYIAPGSSELKQIVNDHYKTKGIHVSADGNWIYMADFGGRKVYRYELLAPGVLGKKELFIDTRCGGMAVDELGNLYISSVDDYKGVLVYNSMGMLLGQILIPDAVSNVTFAGPKRDKLIITTFQSVFSLNMDVKGVEYR